MSSEDSVVVSAPSVDEAISLGLIKLTALRDEVDIEVLDEGSRGFLGLGAREARVRVRLLTDEERQSMESAPSESPEDTVESEPESEPSDLAPAAQMEEDPQPRVSSERAEVAPKAPPSQTPERSEPVSQSSPEETGQPDPAEPAQAPAMPEVVGGVKRSELEAVVQDVAAGLLQDLDVDVTLEWLQEDRPTLWVAIDGKDASALVGSRSRTLHSLQYLFRALTYHRLDGDYNLVVDADAYRKRRRRSLEDLAKRQAKKAIETGKTVRMRSMPAHERRIVHITLRRDDRVTTESVGRGRSRSVTIIPQRANTSG
jgi:spoIIIJ-associated protein